MSDKPLTATLPRFANGGSADVTEPTSGEKDLGWAPDEQPPAQQMNWLHENTYNWLKWLDDGYLTRSDLTNDAPVLATSDRGGAARHYLGPEGYWMGPAIQETHRWSPVHNGSDRGTGTDVSNLNAHMVADTNTQCRIMQPTTTAPATAAPWLRLKVQNVAASQRVYVAHEEQTANGQPIGNLDAVVAVMEWRSFGSTGGANEVIRWGGLHDMTTDTAGNIQSTSNRFAMFRKSGDGPGEDTNWQCVTCDGTAVTVEDSGVPPVNNTWQTFRVELHGVSSEVGQDAGTAVARFFIDGARVAEISTANVPSGNNNVGLFFAHEASAAGPSGDVDYGIGTCKIAWNETLAPDVPA